MALETPLNLTKINTQEHFLVKIEILSNSFIHILVSN